MRLNDIAHQTITDKWDKGHDYCYIYECLFEPIKNDVKHLLEIGIEVGGSIRMFEQYFPNATIHGIDLVHCGDHGTRIKTYIADQSKPEQLYAVMQQINEPICVIIDDGSHVVSDIVISLKTLYPFLKQGGYYLIEDLEHPRRDMEEHLQGYEYWFATSKSPILNSNLIVIRKP